jgi:hypothetical protein
LHQIPKGTRCVPYGVCLAKDAVSSRLKQLAGFFAETYVMAAIAGLAGLA